jgi:hypothetical protein
MSKKDFFHTGLQIGRSQIQSVINGQGPGTIYYVDYRNGADQNDGLSWETAFKKLSAAYAAATSNNNDVILIDGDSTVVETAMITWAKNRIHVFGMNGPSPIFGQGAGAKVELGITIVATDTATLRVTGVRNTFTGIKFVNSNTLATNLHCVEEAGEYNRYINCEFYKSGLLLTDLTAELLMNGDSSSFDSCTFGSLVNTRGASGKECPCVKLDRETVTGKVCRDGVFVDCRFLTKAAHADVCFIYGKNATDVERSLLLVRPIFWNCVLAVADPANAVNFGAAQTDGDVLMIDPTGINISILGGASLNIYVQGAVPTEATTGKAVEIVT